MTTFLSLGIWEYLNSLPYLDLTLVYRICLENHSFYLYFSNFVEFSLLC